MSDTSIKKELGGAFAADSNGGGKPNISQSSTPQPQSTTPQPQTKTNDGWQEIGLYCYNENDIKDKRYHIARFNNKNNIDIIKDFNKPVRLHRKDPRNLQFHLSRKEIEIKKQQQEEKAAAREKRRQQKLAGIPVDEGEDDDDDDNEKDGDVKGNGNNEDPDQIDLSQIAPEGGARNIKKSMFKRKTRRINLMSDEQRKLRYDEYYPWVIEDYDGKNVYVGNYEAGATETTQVLFVFDNNGFKLMPVDKVYKFNPRNKYATLTLEEAEAKMEKKSAVPRWLMKHMEDENSNGMDYRYKDTKDGGLSSRQKVHAPSSNSRFAGRTLRTVTGGSFSNNDRDSDHDDIDFDEEFADDEEAPIIDGDEEENKLSEQKIKREMLKAAHFDGGGDDGDANEDDLDDLFETEKSRKIDKEGRKLRKVLNKTEGGVYDSEDEDDHLNPYLSKSDLESDDDDDDSEVVIKKEYDPNESLSTKPRQFFSYNYGEGFIVIKAPSQFLQQFPRGEWLPTGRKRELKPEEPSSKKLKTETLLGKESNSVPVGDLNDSGPNGSLVTVKEVLDILKDNPLTTKELLIRLRARVNADKENKARIISIVKKNLKLSDGKLVLKE